MRQEKGGGYKQKEAAELSLHKPSNISFVFYTYSWSC